MNLLKIKLTALITSILLASILLLILPLLASGKEANAPMRQPLPISDVTASTETPIISGTYQGTIAITVPVQLGVLDMAFTVEEISGTLSGAVSLTRTLVYSPASTLYGVINNTTGLTPTFRLASDVFEGVVSGRVVRRQFALVGEALEDGEILQGTYTETITGFTPQPMVMEGIFMVTRPPYPQDFDSLTSVDVETLNDTIWINESTPISVTLLNGYREPFTETTRITLTSNLGTITPVAANTSSGVITATFTAGTTSGSAAIAATTGSMTGTTTVEIAGYSPATLALTSTATLLPTGDGQTTVTATVRDQVNQPVSGAAITFAGALGTVSPVTATADADGIVATTFTAGAMPGQAGVTAECDGLEQSVDFQLATAQVSALDLQASVLIVKPGAQVTITATVHDQFDRSMSSELVTFFGSLGTLLPSSGVSDDNGQVVVIFVAGSLSGEATVTALSGYVSNSIIIQVRDTNRAPTAPDEPIPAHGATAVPVTQTLSWHSSDPDGDSLAYLVAFGSSNPPPMAAQITGATFNPGTLMTGTHYYWTITATDSLSLTVGPVWKFTTVGRVEGDTSVYLPLVVRDFP